MDRLVLYLGGFLLVISLAVVREFIPDKAAQLTADEVVPVQEEEVVPREPAGSVHRGMVVGLFPWRDERPRLLEEFRELHELGVNHVSFNFNWYMDTIYEPTVYRGVADARNQTASDLVIGQAITDAHAAGLRVMLFPTIYVLHLGEGEWRGRIQPPDIDVWFASYRALVVSTARLAEQFGAEHLCVGIELISMERHYDQWERIIREVREVYSGDLLYSTNWDARENRPWFRHLDMIAMNAYWELTDKRDADVDELVEAWDGIRREIRPWRERIGLPLIISEIGYRSADGSVTKPWNYFLAGGLDMEEQRRAYEAFFRAWYDDDMLQGVYFYHWFGEGGPTDKSYTPREKPAAGVLQEWYGKMAERDRERLREPDVEPEPEPQPEPDPPFDPEVDPVIDPETEIGPQPLPSPGGDSLEPRGLPARLRPVEFRTTPTLQVRFDARDGWFARGDLLTAESDDGTQTWRIMLIAPVDRLVILRNTTTERTVTLRAR